ncbi:general substrate transporter [Thamnocephalis sphaerospora]|uniref:General substrate transporter n=1 Tax=Thamnocephalis sphaerospora TaxID=78915 RepID=A0A4P9XMY3_9FUNG|nr:general substrate transporter [Thamnocephalis sphaerospora]|eukprot:RKP07265.1 general substrate transporter [Thamnocephalis sphaerospora]
MATASISKGATPGQDSLEAKWTGYTVFCAVSAALAAFNSGYNVGVANAPEQVVRECVGVTFEQKNAALPGCIPMDGNVWGFAIGAFALGGMVGGISASPIMNAIGRRKTLIFNNILFLIGGLLMAFSTTVAQFIIGRVVVGMASGVGSVVAPVYVSEVATLKYRGAFGTLVQLNMVIGILFAQLLGLGLSNAPGWRILFGITIAPSIVQVVFLLFTVETPAFLISRGNEDEAANVLTRLRRGFNTYSELNAIIDSQGGKRAGRKASQSDDAASIERASVESCTEQAMSLIQIIRSPMLKVLIIAVVVHAMQQLTGINSVFFYSTSMFSAAFGGEAARGVTVGIGALNFVMTIITIIVVDRAGRKVLLLGSTAGMVLMSVIIIIGSVYKQNIVVVVAVFLFVACFAVGLGPVPWMLVPELFPTKAVGAASATALGVNWLSNFLVGQLFPLINTGLQDYSFLVFAVTGTLGFIFVYFQLVETKGKTVEEVHAELLGDRAMTSEH